MENVLLEHDNIQYFQLSKDILREAVDVARKSFFIDETVCKAIDLRNNLVAMNELEELFVKAAEDGLSVVAVDKNTKKVAGVTFNKLQVKSQPDIEYYDSYANRCQDLASKSFLSFMSGTDLVVNLFELCEKDCYLEIMFLGVLPEYRGKSIAYRLCEVSINLARILLSGVNVKKALNGKDLMLQPVPKFVSAIFTSPVSQKIGRKLGMQVVGSVSLNTWTYKGQTFAERLGNNVSDIEYQCKMLKPNKL